jgi:hypothetical protein
MAGFRLLLTSGRLPLGNSVVAGYFSIDALAAPTNQT